MRIGRPILMVAMGAALAAYGYDCSIATTADEAMRCCDRMSCSSHGHHHAADCCKTMPSTYSPFLQSSPLPNGHVSLELCGLVSFVGNPHQLDFSVQTLVVARSHAPPILQSAVISPLRI